MEYTFTLSYQLTEKDGNPDALVERLGASGCEDALVGIGQPSRLALEFTREAASARHAVRSALGDVKRAIPSARLIEAVPDFVGLTDVARIVGVSRQNMRKLMLAYSERFPAPVHQGSLSIWHLADVLSWLMAEAGYDVDSRTLEIARAAREVNAAKAAHRVASKAARDLESFVA